MKSLIFSAFFAVLMVAYGQGLADVSSQGCQENGGCSQFIQLAQNDSKLQRGRSIEALPYMPRRIYPIGEKVFVFSPKLGQWAAYDVSGNLVKTGVASGGSTWCEELNRPCMTPRGRFRVQRKGSADCRSSKYPLPNGGAQMPYCMHFHKGYAIHGSPHVPRRNSSHGCIRVKPQAAAWLSHYFIQPGTRVVVLSY